MKTTYKPDCISKCFSQLPAVVGNEYFIAIGKGKCWEYSHLVRLVTYVFAFSSLVERQGFFAKRSLNCPLRL